MSQITWKAYCKHRLLGLGKGLKSGILTSFQTMPVLLV